MSDWKTSHSDAREKGEGIPPMATLRQFLCGLRGHDSLLHFEQGRMRLRCASCGHESPGWDVGTSAPRPRPDSAARSVVQLPLVSERRVA